MNKLTDTISVGKILEVSYFINEKLFKPNALPIITINQLSNYLLEEDLYSLIITCHFKYESSEEKLLEIQVQNVFRIEGLKTLFDNKTQKIRFPEPVLITVLSVSISHTRALLADHTKGTHYQDFFIPITNPQEVANTIFPELFESTDVNQISSAIALQPQL